MGSSGGNNLLAGPGNNEKNLLNGCALTIDKSAVYCIRVVGSLDAGWSDRLGGMTITTSGIVGQHLVTILSGPLIDQAALFGVLKALYDLRLPLLSVECLQVSPQERSDFDRT